MRVFSIVISYLLFSLHTTANTHSPSYGEVLVGADYEVNGITSVNSEGYWLASSQSGILKITSQGKIKTLLTGDYEHIDSVRVNNEDLIASYNNELGQVEVILSNNKYLLEKTNFNLEGLCLFVDEQDHVFLHLIDNFGGVEVRWVYQAKEQQWVDAKIKTVATAPGIESCVANHSEKQLYLLDENIGLWQRPATIENAPAKELFLYRENSAEYQGIAIFGNTFFVSEPEKITRYAFDKESDKKALKIEQSWYVGKDRSPEGLAVIEHNDTALVAYIDDESSIVYTLRFKLESKEEILAPERASKAAYPFVLASAETEPMDRRGDAADDPAIWLNSAKPERSLIIATNKRYGLLVYNIRGELVQSLPVGKVNNVDIRQNNLLAGKSIDIAVASNRSDNTLQLFTIDKKGQVTEAAKISTGMDDVYGVCMYRESPEKLFALVNDKDGRVQQYRIRLDKKTLQGQLVKSFKIKSQPEGCVADDRQKRLFIGEEDVGVWRYAFGLNGRVDEKTASLIAKVGKPLVKDVEGLALYIKGKHRYLIASSQGDNSYAVYNAMPPHNYLGSFRVGLNRSLGIDGTSETDGIAVSSAFFNQDYPAGMLVVQDGFNFMPEEPQNFKLISWENVFKALE